VVHAALTVHLEKQLSQSVQLCFVEHGDHEPDEVVLAGAIQLRLDLPNSFQIHLRAASVSLTRAVRDTAWLNFVSATRVMYESAQRRAQCEKRRQINHHHSH
jgi:hypothetical protein